MPVKSPYSLEFKLDLIAQIEAGSTAATVVAAVALLLILRRKHSAEPTVDAEKVEQTKVTWSPMSGKEVYDVDAVSVGDDGSAHRLTKPVEPGSAPAVPLAGEVGVALLPAAQGVEGGQAAQGIAGEADGGGGQGEGGGV